MTVVSCIALPIVPDSTVPKIDIPGYGELRAVRKSLQSITDPAEYLAQLQGLLSTALAPLKRYLDLLDAMMTVSDCMKAIPEAIITLNPKAITDCLENLFKAVGVLLSYIPPLNYVKMGCSIASFGILCIDEITAIFMAIDQKATQYVQAYDRGVALGDSELMKMSACALGEINVLALNMFDLLKAFSVGMDMFIDFMLKFVPALKEPAKVMKDEMLKLDGIQEALENGDQYLPDATKTEQELIDAANALHDAIPVPPLEPLFVALNALRNVIAMIYNILAPLVGMAADKTTAPVPSFVNF